MDYSTIITSVGDAIDLLGVLAITIGITYSIIMFVAHFFTDKKSDSTYSALRQHLGRTLVVGLELLIAGDIVRSIAVPPSFTSVGVLAIIVLIRAFLSVQIEHGAEFRLPFSGKKKE